MLGKIILFLNDSIAGKVLHVSWSYRFICLRIYTHVSGSCYIAPSQVHSIPNCPVAGLWAHLNTQTLLGTLSRALNSGLETHSPLWHSMGQCFYTAPEYHMGSCMGLTFPFFSSFICLPYFWHHLKKKKGLCISSLHHHCESCLDQQNLHIYFRPSALSFHSRWKTLVSSE